MSITSQTANAAGTPHLRVSDLLGPDAPVPVAVSVFFSGVLVFSIFSTAWSPSAASSVPAKEYIPYHPSGCQFVRKNQDGSFNFVQSCIRPQRQTIAMPGAWQQLIEAKETVTPGVIVIPRQTLINELDIE